MIKIYRKTAAIKAEKFDPENGVIPDGVFDKEFEYTTSDMLLQMMKSAETGVPIHNWYIKTLKGDLKVNPGDWIATGVNGEHWAIADEVFKKTYAELPVIPENVAYIIKQAKKGDYKLGWVFNATYLGLWRVSVGNWIRTHADTVARAWLDGYVVEEDK